VRQAGQNRDKERLASRCLPQRWQSGVCGLRAAVCAQVRTAVVIGISAGALAGCAASGRVSRSR